MATEGFINDEKDEVNISQFDPSSIEQIEQLVHKPTWREILLEIVELNNLDPWNIDISIVTNSYLEKIRKMKIEDLHIPANVILAASILLRFKAQAFEFEEPEPVIEETVMEEVLESAEMEMLQLKMRIQPKRAITLPDLITALEEAIKIETKREKERVFVSTAIEFKPPEYDIEKETKNIFETILKNSDENGMILFSELLKLAGKKGPRDTVLTFLPLLHLCQRNKIMMTQEEFFGEIIIKKLNENEIKDSEDESEES